MDPESLECTLETGRTFEGWAGGLRNPLLIIIIIIVKGFILVRVRGNLEPFPGTLGARQEYTLDGVPCTHTFILKNHQFNYCKFFLYILVCFFPGYRRKPMQNLQHNDLRSGSDLGHCSHEVATLPASTP